MEERHVGLGVTLRPESSLELSPLGASLRFQATPGLGLEPMVWTYSREGQQTVNVQLGARVRLASAEHVHLMFLAASGLGGLRDGDESAWQSSLSSGGGLEWAPVRSWSVSTDLAVQVADLTWTRGSFPGTSLGFGLFLEPSVAAHLYF